MSTPAGNLNVRDPLKKVGTLVHYDNGQYPFPDLFSECVASFLRKKGLRPAPSLDRLHTVINFAQLSELYPWLFSMIHGAEYQKLYQRFIQTVIGPLFPRPIQFQRIPNPRVQLPKGRTVQYHTDEWYGHGRQVFNFWLPLTRAFGSNTLLAASLEDSVRLCRGFEREKRPQHDINSRSAKFVKPVECGPGQFFIFNAQCIHGTEQNRTAFTRMSMDFRILQIGDSSGDKPVDAYYRTLSQTSRAISKVKAPAKPYTAAAYVYPRYGFTRFVSQPNQRLIIDAFAKKQNAIIVDEETEIRTMPHHPALLQLATGSGLEKINAVILYSVLCLPPHARDRKKILDTARRSGVRLFFASETLQFPSPDTQPDIDAHYRRLLRA